MKTNKGYGAIIAVHTTTKSKKDYKKPEIAVSNTAIS
jgi:hypothetical protein